MIYLVSYSHNFTEDGDFPDATVGNAGNKCRNPRKDEVTLWCFTADNGTTGDTTTNWDFCDVPLCPEGNCVFKENCDLTFNNLSLLSHGILCFFVGRYCP